MLRVVFRLLVQIWLEIRGKNVKTLWFSGIVLPADFQISLPGEMRRVATAHSGLFDLLPQLLADLLSSFGAGNVQGADF